MQRRTPGTTRIEDRWTRRDGTPSTRHGQGKRWLLRWIDHNGDEKTASYTRKIDATQHEKTITAQFHNGEYIDRNAGRATLTDTYNRWTEATKPTIKPSSAINRASAWNKHLKEHWGNREVSAIRKTDIQEWVAQKHSQGTGGATIDRALFVLRATLTHAVDAGLLTHNPAQGVKAPRTKQQARPILTTQQVELLAQTVEYLPQIIRFLAYTGLRFGEASALTVQDIDLTRRRIDVSKAYSDVGGHLILGTPKSHEARSVPFPSALDSDLRTLTSDKLRTSLIFTSVELKPLRHNNYRKRFFRPAVVTLQENCSDFPTLTLHDLRHTAASLAISAGANVKAVQRMLGHASATLTLDRYTDLFPDDLDQVARDMDALIYSGLRADQTAEDPHSSFPE